MRLRGLIGAGALLMLALTAAAPADATLKPVGGFGVYDTTDAAGSVDGPEGVGVDPISGRVAVPDYGYERVSVFGPTGRFLFAFGEDVRPGGGTGPEVCRASCQTGNSSGEAGALHNPEDVEFSPDGRQLWVSDNSNSRISVFNRGGRFLFAFGLEVEPGPPFGFERCEEVCQQGTNGDDAGAMNSPWGAGFGPRGTFWVADTDNNRVQSFTRTGNFRLALGRDVAVGGSTGYETCDGSGLGCKAGTTNGSGSLSRPEGLDFDQRGRLWAGSYDEHHVNVYGRGLGFVRTFGKNVDPGGGDGFETCSSAICFPGTVGDELGELNSPHGIAVSGDGRAFVSDAGNNRLAAFSPRSRPLFAFGANVIPGGGGGPETCTRATTCQQGEADLLNTPYGLSVDCRGVLFVNTSGISESRPVIRAFSENRRAEPKPCRLRAKGVRKGKLRVFVPYAGKVTLTGRGLRRTTARHRGLGGTEKLAIRPRGGAEGTVRARIALKPSDGNAKQTAVARIRLG